MDDASRSVDDEGQELSGPIAHRLADVGPVSHAIVQIIKLHKALTAQMLRPLGLHLSQELVMMQLWDAGPQRQADLVRLLNSDAATITRTIRRLELAGFVRRTPSQTDGRSTIVSATTSSRALRAEVENAWRVVEAATVAELDPVEQQQALALLAGIIAGLERALRTGDSR